jgi:predicted NBD/HSP70 family sugar kinase
MKINQLTQRVLLAALVAGIASVPDPKPSPKLKTIEAEMKRLAKREARLRTQRRKLLPYSIHVDVPALNTSVRTTNKAQVALAKRVSDRLNKAVMSDAEVDLADLLK